MGMISDWALMAPQAQRGDGLILNWYGLSAMTARLASGTIVTLTQETDYPRENRVRLRMAPNRAARFALKLRIPHWSQTTRVKVNGQSVSGVTPASYLVLERTWKRTFNWACSTTLCSRGCTKSTTGGGRTGR